MSTRPTPEVRLAISRERIRLALRATSPPPTATAGAPGSIWLGALQSEPGINAILETLRVWWAQHPLQAVGAQWAPSLRAALGPMAQSHPLGLMLAAFAAGGLIALAKPWRWFSVPGSLAGVLPQVLVALVAQVPPATWLDGLGALLRRGSPPVDPEKSAPPAPG